MLLDGGDAVNLKVVEVIDLTWIVERLSSALTLAGILSKT